MPPACTSPLSSSRCVPAHLDPALPTLPRESQASRAPRTTNVYAALAGTLPRAPHPPVRDVSHRPDPARASPSHVAFLRLPVHPDHVILPPIAAHRSNVADTTTAPANPVSPLTLPSLTRAARPFRRPPSLHDALVSCILSIMLTAAAASPTSAAASELPLASSAPCQKPRRPPWRLSIPHAALLPAPLSPSAIIGRTRRPRSFSGTRAGARENCPTTRTPA
ncbi:hypothetical protein B0H13DRAFT_2580650 [Mycena leptocephala]|nr:hypothetical protein B0H13DRAFT_2580650 [Mycena leptocephala]